MCICTSPEPKAQMSCCRLLCFLCKVFTLSSQELMSGFYPNLVGIIPRAQGPKPLCMVHVAPWGPGGGPLRKGRQLSKSSSPDPEVVESRYIAYLYIHKCLEYSLCISKAEMASRRKGPKWENHSYFLLLENQVDGF